jgi:hypothetical protein
MDAVSITTLVVSIIGALGHFIKEAHIMKCTACFCINSDCNKNKTPPITPSLTNDYSNV